MFQHDDLEFLQEMHQLKEICKIGEGSFGKVFKAIDLQDNSECAVKVISKTLFKDAQMESEIYQQLNHPHIVNCKRITENKNHYFLVMELMNGGTLSNRMKIKYNDIECAIIMKGILMAVHYLHEKKIIHRDLKPENIMFLSQDITSVKIADFGLSFKFSSEGMFYSLLNKKCGTIIYMAPEQFKEKYYSKQVDSWSCGIIMYQILTGGQHPFYNKYDSKEQVIKKIINPKWKFPDDMNPLAQDLILKLTTLEPIERYNISQALIHPWITRNENDKIPLTYQEQLIQFLKTQEIRNSFKLLFFIQYIQKYSPTIIENDNIEEKNSEKKVQQKLQSLPSPKVQKYRVLSNNQKIKNIRAWSPKNYPPKSKSKPKPKTSFENLNTLEDQRTQFVSFKSNFQQKSYRPKTKEENYCENVKSHLLIKPKQELPPLKRK